MKKIGLFIAFLFLGSIVQDLFCQDQVIFHTDKPYYVPGEIIWYKAYLPESFENQNLYFKVIIADENGKKVSSYFTQNEGASVSSHYQIPHGLKTGNYAISFNLLDERTNTQSLYSKHSLAIFNDLEKVNVTATETSSVPDLKSEVIPASLEVSFDKSIYRPGENVQIRLKSSALIVDYSISVNDQNLIGAHHLDDAISATNTSLDLESGVIYSSKPYVQGTVSNKQGKGLKLNQLGVYDQEKNEMLLARSDKNGDFTLFLPDARGEKKYQFAGYISNEAGDVIVSLAQDQIDSKLKAPSIDSSMLEYLNASQLRRKIYQYYGTLENALPLLESQIQKKEIKADKTYNMRQYQSFASLGNFFDEMISSPLKFEVNNGDVTATMYDSEGFKRYNSLGAVENFTFPPVFIVNGKLTRNANYIYSLPMDEIENVDLYTFRKSLAQMVGNFRNYGLAVITSTNPNLTVPVEDEQGIKEVNGIQASRDFTSLKSFEIDMPVLRPLLYWNPSISSGDGIQRPLIITASDDISTFAVKVVAKTKNGEIIQGQGTFTTQTPKG